MVFCPLRKEDLVLSSRHASHVRGMFLFPLPEFLKDRKKASFHKLIERPRARTHSHQGFPSPPPNLLAKIIF